MRFNRHLPERAEGDLTPMIDMTFQLIAFFMVLINFTEADQNEQITLPASELAKPPEAPFEHPVFVQLTRQATVILSGQEVPLDGLKPFMIREKDFLRLRNKTPSAATIVVRADASAPVGTVQEVIQICQELEFDTFVLRAEEQIE